MRVLAEISKIIDRHRAVVVITCEESCWCWGVEAAICGHTEIKKEQAFQGGHKDRCGNCGEDALWEGQRYCGSCAYPLCAA